MELWNFVIIVKIENEHQPNWKQREDKERKVKTKIRIKRKKYEQREG
jgi:hypothetical protein